MDLGESPSVVKEFVQKKKATFTVLIGNPKTIDEFGIDTTPTNIVVGPDGKVVFEMEGFDQAEIEAAVHKAQPRHIARRTAELSAPETSLAVFQPVDSLSGVEGTPARTRLIDNASAGSQPGTGTPGAGSSNTTPRVPAGPFPDVPADHWAAASVQLLRDKGIVIGYPPAPPSESNTVSPPPARANNAPSKPQPTPRKHLIPRHRSR